MTLLDDYRAYLKEQGLAENTILTYSRHVGEYCQWYKDTFGHEMVQLYHTNILDFRSYQQNIKKLKFKSIDTKLSSLSSFNEYLVQKGAQKELVITAGDCRRPAEIPAGDRKPGRNRKERCGGISPEGVGGDWEEKLCDCRDPRICRPACQRVRQHRPDRS